MDNLGVRGGYGEAGTSGAGRTPTLRYAGPTCNTDTQIVSIYSREVEIIINSLAEGPATLRRDVHCRIILPIRTVSLDARCMAEYRPLVSVN